jgi:hypothetical protein
MALVSDKAAPGIRAWDSAKCPMCKAPLGGNYIQLSLRSRHAEPSAIHNLKFCAECYKKIDGRRFSFDDFYCLACSKGVEAGEDYVLCQDINRSSCRTVYIMHVECFDDLTGPGFWGLDFSDII